MLRFATALPTLLTAITTAFLLGKISCAQIVEGSSKMNIAAVANVAKILAFLFTTYKVHHGLKFSEAENLIF